MYGSNSSFTFATQIRLAYLLQTKTIDDANMLYSMFEFMSVRVSVCDLHASLKRLGTNFFFWRKNVFRIFSSLKL